MQKPLGSLFVLALCIGACFGCNRSVPIQNTSSLVPNYENITREQVRDAIVRGGMKAGWHMREDGPDKLLATYVSRGKHTAVVSIPYDEKSYQLNYASSVNLRAEDGAIHRNYNRWLNNLTMYINNELNMIRTQ
jgi:hypothetical protein